MNASRQKAISAGADCANCPIGADTFIAPDPVYPEYPRSRSSLVVVGEGPGPTEIRTGRFFDGPSGVQLDNCLARVGTHRSRVNVTNATLCIPPKGMSQTDLRKAAHACRPRLRKDLERMTRWGSRAVIVAMGAAALYSLCGPEYKTIFPWIGGPLPLAKDLKLKKATVVPCLHPAFAIREPQYWVAILNHLSLALDIIHNRPLPKWQKLVTAKDNNEAPKAIKALREIRKRGLPVGVDIEGAGKSPWAPTTAVGIGDEKVSVSMLAHVFFRSDIFALCKEILETHEIIAQNGWHDVLGLRQDGIEIGQFKWDTIDLHATLAPFMKHNLGLIAAIEFPGLDRWKSAFKDDDRKGSVEWKTVAERRPDDLLIYNAKDTAILPRLKKSLAPQVMKVARYRNDYETLMKLSAIAADMRVNGIATDQEARKRLQKAIKIRRASALNELRRLAKKSGYRKHEELTPRRRSTLIDLFFNHLGLRVIAKSEKTNTPQVDEKAIVKLMLENPDETVQGILRKTLSYRKFDKLSGTYLARLDPNHPDPHVDRKGIIRASFNEAGAGTRRFSCDSPNMQNWPPAMRELLCVQNPNAWFVCADYGQLELRIEAAFSGDDLLLEAFATGADIHNANARALFYGNRPEAIIAKADRTLAKRYVYGRRGGSPKAIWEAIVIEAPDSGITVGTIQKTDRAWNRAHPKMKAHADWIVDFAREHDFIELPISGRRIQYHRRVKPTEPIAHEIQGTGADVMNLALIELSGMIDLQREKIVSQVHDEIMIETLDPVRTAEKLSAAMTRKVTLNGNEILLPVDFKVGKSLYPIADASDYPRKGIKAWACETIEEVAKVTKTKRKRLRVARKGS